MTDIMVLSKKMSQLHDAWNYRSQDILQRLMSYGESVEKVGSWVSMLNDSDFSQPYDEIFRIIKTRLSQSKPVDFLTLGEDTSLNEYVRDIIKNSFYTLTYSFDVIESFVEQMIAIRNIISYLGYSHEIISAVCAQKTFDDCVKLENDIKNFNPDLRLMSGHDSISIQDDVNEYLIDYDKGDEESILTGFGSIDAALKLHSNGIPASSLVCVVGGTKQGKSSLALAMFIHAVDPDQQALIFSMEIKKKELYTNIAAQLAQISRTDLARHIDNTETANARQRLVEWANKHEYVVVRDDGVMYFEDILSRIRLASLKRKIKVVLVDHLGLIRSKNKVENIFEQQNQFVASLRSLAQELGFMAILVAQAGKASQPDETRAPKGDDVRGAISVMTDCHLLLSPRKDAKLDKMQVYCLFNRNGNDNWMAELKFYGGTLKDLPPYEKSRN